MDPSAPWSRWFREASAFPDQRYSRRRAKGQTRLLNSLSNAIKFTLAGGRVDVRATTQTGGSIEVSISDTGVGIAPEDQDTVFEEFRQVGASTAKYEGTGVGLALCRKFLELHGGSIWIKSQIGSGSTFTFAIPVRRGE